MKVFILGTIKQNKLEVPKEFLKGSKTNIRAINSTYFAFKDFMSIVSYVPKKNKAVVLLSSKHHFSKINEKTMKPEIIMDYNKFKGILYAFN